VQGCAERVGGELQRQGERSTPKTRIEPRLFGPQVLGEGKKANKNIAGATCDGGETTQADGGAATDTGKKTVGVEKKVTSRQGDLGGKRATKCLPAKVKKKKCHEKRTSGRGGCVLQIKQRELSPWRNSLAREKNRKGRKMD